MEYDFLKLAAVRPDESALVERVREIFRLSHGNYGTRKIKKEFAKKGTSCQDVVLDVI